MASSNSDDEIRLLIQSVHDNQVCSVISVASLAATLYDTIIYFPDEYRLIWAAEWTSGKYLYVGCRYLTQIYLMSSIIIHLMIDCSLITMKGWYYSSICLAAMSSLCPEIVYVLRTQVLYPGRKVIKWFIVILFLSEQIFKWSMISLLIAQSRFSQPSIAGLPCIFSISILHEQIGTMMYIAAFALELILWTISLHKLLPLVLSGQRSIVLIIFRDGGLYFTTVTLLCFSQMVVSLTVIHRRPSLGDAMDPIMMCMSCILSSHLILNLRGHVYKESNTEDRYATMEFKQTTPSNSDRIGSVETALSM